MKQYTLFVPLNMNDGAAIPAGYLDGVIERVIDLTGGCTVTPEVVGYWRDNGRLYKDRTVTVSTYCSAQYHGSLVALAARVAHDLQQESVLLAHGAAETEYVTARHALAVVGA